MKQTARQLVVKMNSAVLMGSTYSMETNVSGVIMSVTRQLIAQTVVTNLTAIIPVQNRDHLLATMALSMRMKVRNMQLNGNDS